MLVRAARMIAMSFFALAGALACGLATFSPIRNNETLIVMIGGGIVVVLFSLSFYLDCADIFESDQTTGKVFLLRAWRDIPRGTIVSDYRTLFEFGGETIIGSQPVGALTALNLNNFEQLTGQRVTRELKKGEIILATDLETIMAS